MFNGGTGTSQGSNWQYSDSFAVDGKRQPPPVYCLEASTANQSLIES